MQSISKWIPFHGSFFAVTIQRDLIGSMSHNPLVMSSPSRGPGILKPLEKWTPIAKGLIGRTKEQEAISIDIHKLILKFAHLPGSSALHRTAGGC